MKTVDYTLHRNLDRNQLERFASLDFIKEGGNILITGCSGTGKSYIATVIGYQACRLGIKTYYSSTYEAIGDDTVADAILDRIVHTAHKIELTGESIRKVKGSKCSK